MSMKKNITIDGREVAFKASAAIPRIYRMKFHRDIFKDLRDLEKSIDKNDPEMTTPLFLLRCVQLGLSIRDLDLLTIGMVNDMYVESRNDEYTYAVVATQKDFDQF